jgi:hypothetical protein
VSWIVTQWLVPGLANLGSQAAAAKYLKPGISLTDKSFYDFDSELSFSSHGGILKRSLAYLKTRRWK